MNYDLEDIHKLEQVNKHIVEKEKNQLIVVLAQESLQLIEDWKEMNLTIENLKSDIDGFIDCAKTYKALKG